MGADSSDKIATIAQPITLPCGLRVPLHLLFNAADDQLPNRLAKAPMEELLAPYGGSPPTPEHVAGYERWAGGRYGVVITGNVAVDPKHLGSPFDISLTESDLTDPVALAHWRRWAVASKLHDTPAIVQLCHAGRQSARGGGRSVFTPPLAPSAVPIRVGDDLTSRVLADVIFGTPRAMTTAQVREVIQMFVRGAVMSHKAGFDGVQLHCSHGYLLAQFLSPKTNIRTDEFGGSPERRIKVVLDILRQIREQLPASFCVGVKLNSSDYVSGGLTQDEALKHVQWLSEAGLDFCELSGGTYEGTEFFGDDKPKAPSESKREAFFAEFGERAKAVAGSMAIMLTGGIRTRTGMADIISSGTADLIGLGRPSAMEPDLPHRLLDPAVPDAQARAVQYEIQGTKTWRKIVPTRLVGSGVAFAYHACAIMSFARGREPDPKATFLSAVLREFAPRWLPWLVLALLGLPAGLIVRAAAAHVRSA